MRAPADVRSGGFFRAMTSSSPQAPTCGFVSICVDSLGLGCGRGGTCGLSGCRLRSYHRSARTRGSTVGLRPSEDRTHDHLARLLPAPGRLPRTPQASVHCISIPRRRAHLQPAVQRLRNTAAEPVSASRCSRSSATNTARSSTGNATALPARSECRDQGLGDVPQRLWNHTSSQCIHYRSRCTAPPLSPIREADESRKASVDRTSARPTPGFSQGCGRRDTRRAVGTGSAPVDFPHPSEKPSSRMSNNAAIEPRY